MCFEAMSHHGGRHYGGLCGCHPHVHSGPRHLWTKKEKAAYFGQYLKGLREEIRAVEEKIAELKREK